MPQIRASREGSDLTTTLSAIAAQDAGSSVGLHAAYGELYRILRTHRPSADYNAPRLWLTQHAGQTITTMRDRWVNTDYVSRKFGISVRTVRKQLKEAGYDISSGGQIPRTCIDVFDRFEGGPLQHREAARMLGDSLSYSPRCISKVRFGRGSRRVARLQTPSARKAPTTFPGRK